MFDQVVYDENTIQFHDDPHKRNLIANYKPITIQSNEINEEKSKNDLFDFKEENKNLIGKFDGKTISMTCQIILLLEREFIFFKRKANLQIDLFILSTFTSIAVAIGAPRTIPHSAGDIQYLIAAGMISSLLWIYTCIVKYEVYAKDKSIIRHEVITNRYHPFPHYFVHCLLYINSSIFSAISYSSISFWIVGFSSSFWSYCSFVLSYILCGISIIVIAHIFIYLVDDIDLMGNLIIILFPLYLDYSGFVCFLPDVPSFVRWLSWLNPLRYISEMSMSAYLTGQFFECVDGKGSFLVPGCPVSGDSLIEVYGYSPHPFLRDTLIFLSANFFIIFVTYFIYLCI